MAWRLEVPKLEKVYWKLDIIIISPSVSREDLPRFKYYSSSLNMILMILQF